MDHPAWLMIMILVYGVVLIYLLWRIRQLDRALSQARETAKAYATVQRVHEIAMFHAEEAARPSSSSGSSASSPAPESSAAAAARPAAAAASL